MERQLWRGGGYEGERAAAGNRLDRELDGVGEEEFLSESAVSGTELKVCVSSKRV